MFIRHASCKKSILIPLMYSIVSALESANVVEVEAF